MRDDPGVQQGPADWSAAFASLPLEPAPAGGWEAVQARLSTTDASAAPPAARPRRGRWMLAAALAAVAATATGLLWRPSSGPGPAPVATRDIVPPPTPGAHSPGDRPAVDPGAPKPTPETAIAARTVEDADRPVARATGTASRRPTASRHARQPAGLGRTAGAPERSIAAMPRAQPETDGDLVAGADTTPAVAVGEGDGATPALSTLQAESRRLEAVLAAMRDEQASSAVAVVLASSLDDRVGVIDAALAQSTDPAEQADLWRARVLTLQELAGLQGTRRWLAVHGRTLDGALARVD